RLSPREAWLLRGVAVLRAHDAWPHFSWSLLSVDMDGRSSLQFPLPTNRECWRTRSHCSAGHDLSPVVSRDDKRSKNRARAPWPPYCDSTVLARTEAPKKSRCARRALAILDQMHYGAIVDRDSISQRRLATVTTEIDEPSITFPSRAPPQVFLMGAPKKLGRPEPRSGQKACP